MCDYAAAGWLADENPAEQCEVIATVTSASRSYKIYVCLTTKREQGRATRAGPAGQGHISYIDVGGSWYMGRQTNKTDKRLTAVMLSSPIDPAKAEKQNNTPKKSQITCPQEREHSKK